MNIPSGHNTIMPYLILNKADKFSQFVSDVFGAELRLNRLREDGDIILHSEFSIGDCTVMFASANEMWPPQTASLFIYVQNADTTFNNALGHGAVSVMNLTDQDYGRTCGIKDPFGNTWWITSLHNPKP